MSSLVDNILLMVLGITMFKQKVSLTIPLKNGMAALEKVLKYTYKKQNFVLVLYTHDKMASIFLIAMCLQRKTLALPGGLSSSLGFLKSVFHCRIFSGISTCTRHSRHSWVILVVRKELHFAVNGI